MYLSIIVPAYNEQNRIGLTLSKISTFLKTKDYEYEVIVVDDGSTDRTVAAVQQSLLYKEGKAGVIKNWLNFYQYH